MAEHGIAACPHNAYDGHPLNGNSTPPRTVRSEQKPSSAARSGPLQDVPGAGIPHSRRAPYPRRHRLYRSLDGLLGRHKDTTRRATLFWRHKCADFRIDIAGSNRHQIGFAGQLGKANNGVCGVPSAYSGPFRSLFRISRIDDQIFPETFLTR